MTPFVCAGAGFLLAVLWFDLMFDVQAWPPHEDPGRAPAERALDSISDYYARVTTAARPMNRLIAVAMAATLAAIVVEIVRGAGPGWLPWISLVLAAAPICLAATRTIPAAVRLGTRRDTAAVRSELARRVLAEHLFCFASIAALIAVQLGWG
jgi:hypothetical protein